MHIRAVFSLSSYCWYPETEHEPQVYEDRSDVNLDVNALLRGYTSWWPDFIC
jgi:hypothetical protein